LRIGIRLNKIDIVHRSAIKPGIKIIIFYFVALLTFTQLFAPNYFSAYGQPLSDTDALIVMVNIERIRTQLWLTEQSLDKNNPEMAFAHAFIPHTTTFPAIKGQLQRSIGDQSTIQIESLLTDLPLKMRAGEYRSNTHAA
jgi:hypothetical protein